MAPSNDVTSAIAAIRKRRNQWRYVRWVQVVSAILMFALGLRIYLHEDRNIERLTATSGPVSGSDLALVAIDTDMQNIGYLFAILGLVQGAIALARWRDDPAEVILLSLAEKSAQDTETSRVL